MKYRFDGPVMVCDGFERHPDYKITVNLSRIVKDSAGTLKIVTSDQGDDISWITIYVRKKTPLGEFEEKPVDIKCDNYEQVIQIVSDLMEYREKLVRQIREFRTKPWLKKRILDQKVVS